MDPTNVKNQKNLQRDVLQYLLEHGPISWNMLSVHFDPYGTAEVEPVLQEMKEWKHIEVGLEGRVRISESGLELLKEER